MRCTLKMPSSVFAAAVITCAYGRGDGGVACAPRPPRPPVCSGSCCVCGFCCETARTISLPADRVRTATLARASDQVRNTEFRIMAGIIRAYNRPIRTIDFSVAPRASYFGEGCLFFDA